MSLRRSIGLGLAATGALAATGPCDIYAQGNTPCVAAHSTTRALYGNYNGALYQVTRNSDGATTDVYPLSAGGIANAATQDNFCGSSTCSISVIYDQSSQKNHLTRALKGYFSGPQSDGSDDLAGVMGAPITLNGSKAYGVFVSPGTGYRNNQATGIATGDAAEGMYAVMDGTHYNDQCCFDYGNAETNSRDTGNGHMEAIYFGNCTVWGSGAGTGPWVMADLENGLFSGQTIAKLDADPTLNNRFITSVVKGQPNQWSIRGGNANSGGLSTFYSGQRPDGYQPMSKEGAIILGIGGDNSNGAQGTFYEGVMTSGYPSDATENSVQANIVAAGYSTRALNSGQALTVGNAVSLHATTPGYTTNYLAHSGSTVNLQQVSSSNTTAQKQTASWTVRTGLGNGDCFSFESVDSPGSFIRHSGFQLYLQARSNEKQFSEDATFCTQPGLNGKGTSFRAWNFPAKYIRHYAKTGYVAAQGGPHAFDTTGSYANDVSFTVDGTSFN